jgi:predicted RNase H-like HicB family nuclease
MEVPELPGCFSQGDDVADAKRMAREAIALWLEVAEEDGGSRVAR